jgi:chromate reductase
MTNRFQVLMVSGSLRQQSTNTAVLRTARWLAPATVDAYIYEGLGGLPHFNPDNDVDPLPTAVADLRARIRAAEALVFSVPEYAGALPGSLKNLLDWTIGDDQPGSIYGKPVGWINASPRGAANAHDQLRQVLGYAHATIIEPACVHVSVTTAMIGDDGLITDAGIRAHIAEALTSLEAQADRANCPMA